MPRQQPFTALCQQLARRPLLDRADLHLHTTFSDGNYTPAEVVNLALRSGLCAIAITDHDTLDGVLPARTAAMNTGLEVISAVEITAEHDGRELHLLGYFVSLDASPLTIALERLRYSRRDRFKEMVDRLRGQGVALEPDELPDEEAHHVLGRRHLAELLVRLGRVGSVREAFQRYLHDGGRADVPKQRLPIEEALACVREAGGVSSWAHPPANVEAVNLAPLAAMGLTAIEAVYPSYRASWVKRLRALAESLGLLITGGSDCHGDGRTGRDVGACTISKAELETLRERANLSTFSSTSRGSCLHPL